MSEAKKPCRHKNAWPTIYNRSLGYFWCPDCGAIRQARTLTPPGSGTNTNVGSIVFAEDHWIYPKGKASALEQMERANKT